MKPGQTKVVEFKSIGNNFLEVWTDLSADAIAEVPGVLGATAYNSSRYLVECDPRFFIGSITAEITCRAEELEARAAQELES